MNTPGRRRLRSTLRLIVAAAVAAAMAGCGSGALDVPTPKHRPPLDTKPIYLPGGAKGVWGNPLNGVAPKALLILIHGGSWKGIDPASFRSMLGTAPVYRQIGLETLTVDYRHGAKGVTDVDALYRIARQRVDGRFPICAAGVSAGGHLALMLAVREPDLACALSIAGPTDLPLLKTEPHGTLSAYTIAINAFGKSLLTGLSPALHADSIRAKLLLLYAQNDPLVPVGQGYAMKRADPRADLIVLPPGTVPFVHTGVGVSPFVSGVDAKANVRAQHKEIKFLDSVAAAS